MEPGNRRRRANGKSADERLRSRNWSALPNKSESPDCNRQGGDGRPRQAFCRWARSKGLCTNRWRRNCLWTIRRVCVHWNCKAVSTLGQRLYKPRVSRRVAKRVTQLVDGGIQSLIEIAERFGRPQPFA